VVLYGFETRSLIVREEHRLRAFENRALRKVSELKDGGYKKEYVEKCTMGNFSVAY
jgi:hypothetical protein